MKRILVVDDDMELCELLEAYFEREGFAFRHVHDGIAGIREALSGKYDVMVLDVMLPGCDGFEVLREVRNRTDLPVLLLTARTDHVDRIVGFELGADDYIPKPFHTRELAARIRAVLRRTERRNEDVPGALRGREEELFVVGDLECRPGARSVKVGGVPVELTGTEFRLLETLLVSAGRLVSLERLSRDVLGRRHSPFDRSLGVHMSRLRKKLGPYGDGAERIHTVRSEGYVYVFPGEDCRPGKADAS